MKNKVNKRYCKTKFIDNVLKDSNQLRKQSELLAIQLGVYSSQMHKVMMQGDFNTDVATEKKNLLFFSVILKFYRYI